MQIRVKLSVLNENAAKQLQLHLDPSQSPSRHMGSTARIIDYSVKISDPNKRDAKRKTDDRGYLAIMLVADPDLHKDPASLRYCLYKWSFLYSLRNLTTLASNFYYTSEFPTIPSELVFSSGSLKAFSICFRSESRSFRSEFVSPR